MTARWSAVLATLAIGLGGCAATPTPPPSSTVASARSYSICPPAGELPAKEINDDAMRILRERLEILGVSEPEITLGECIEVTVRLATQDPDVVEAVVMGTGDVAIYPVPLEQAAAVVVGGEGPIGVSPIIASDDFVDASTDGGANGDANGGAQHVTLGLSDAGAAALGSWTTAHVGESLAVVVDNVVVALPVIEEPMKDASVVVRLAGTESPPVPADAIRTMVTTGPLPPDWAQPQRPQG